MSVTSDEPLQTKKISVTYTEWGEYRYFASFAVSFGYRSIPTNDPVTLNKIWADGQLIYDGVSGKINKKRSWYFLPGTETQTPPPGATLAYRGQMVLWFTDWDLGESGSLPAISAEFQDGDNITVLDAVTLISERAGYDPANIVVSDVLGDIPILGYILDGQATLESVSTDLGFLYDFTFAETNATIYFITNFDTDGNFVPTVELDDPAVIRENADGQEIDNIQISSDQQLPRQITATYFDAGNHNQAASQVAQRHFDQVSSTSDVSLSVPVIMTGAEMRSRLFDALARSFDERNGHSLRLPPKYAYLDPTDALAWGVYGSQYQGTIVKATLNADWSTSITLTERGAELHSNDVETQVAIPTEDVIVPSAVRLVLMDIPDTDPSQTHTTTLNLRVAMGAYQADDWNGATLQIAPQDQPGNWSQAYVAGEDSEVGIGELNEFTDVDTLVMDPKNFNLNRFNAADDDEIANGANKLVVGANGRYEILQFREFSYDDVTGFLTLTGLERGLYGTDDWVDQHEQGDTVVFFDDTTTLTYTVEDFRKYIRYVFRAVPAFEEDPETLDVVLYQPQGNSRKPYSPDNVQVTRTADGDLVFTWDRDNRFDGEPDNVYSIDIFNADWSQLIRRGNAIPGQTWTYRIEEQTTDGLNLDTTHNVLVYQINASHVGRGFPGGGALAEFEEGILAGTIGPIKAFHANGPLEGSFGRVIAMVGTLEGGRDITQLDGAFGIVRGLSGQLRGSEAYAIFGRVAGLYAELSEVTSPTLFMHLKRVLPGGPAPGLNYLPLPGIRRGDLLVVRDLIYGRGDHSYHTRDESFAAWNVLAVQDDTGVGPTAGWRHEIYSFVVDDPLDAPIVALGDGATINPINWKFTEVFVFRHIDVDDPIGDFALNHVTSNTALHVAPAVTTTTDNSLVVMSAGSIGNNPKHHTPPADMESLGSFNSTNDDDTLYFGGDNGGVLTGAMKLIEDSGTVWGPKTFTYVVAKPYGAFSVAVNFGVAPLPDLLPFEWSYLEAHSLSSTDLELDIPAGHAGDLIYIFIFRSGTTTPFTASGYTSKWSVNETICVAQLLYKETTSAAGEHVTLSSANGGNNRAVAYRISNHNGEEHFSVIGYDNNGFDVDIPAVSTGTDGELIIAFAAVNNAGLPGTWADRPAGYTTEIDAYGSGAPGIISMSYQQNFAGDVGTLHFEANDAQRRAGAYVTIRPSTTDSDTSLLNAVFGPVTGFYSRGTISAEMSESLSPFAFAGSGVEIIEASMSATLSAFGFSGSATQSSSPSVVGTADSGAVNGNPTVNIPSGSVGDLLILLINHSNSANGITTPTGWTMRQNLAAAAFSSTRYFVLTRVADGTEGSSLTITGGGSIDNRAVIIRIANATYHTSSGQYDDNNNLQITAPSVTTTVANEFVVAVGFGSASGGLTNIDSGWTSIINTGTTHSTIGAFYKTFASAGATGAFHADQQSAQRRAGSQVALQP